uniref:Mitochondrial import inner membrane translocase subunit n=1 Tax=Otus sunia TaxID=257818 RepID=A0A8C8B714_9STRI
MTSAAPAPEGWFPFSPLDPDLREQDSRRGPAAAPGPSHGLSPQRMTDKCFRKCIGKPGGALDNSEQKCIAMCMDRYMDSWNTVSRAYNSRLQRERANM